MSGIKINTGNDSADAVLKAFFWLNNGSKTPENLGKLCIRLIGPTDEGYRVFRAATHWINARHSEGFTAEDIVA